MLRKQRGLTLTEVLLLLALVLVAAAIVIPSVIRARVSSGEGCCIGDLRTVSSAEATFSSAADGAYGELECLSAPAGCIKGYTGPTFVDQTIASLTTMRGYVRTFHPGKPVTNRVLTRGGLDGYCYGAMPAPQAPGLLEALAERLGKPGSRSYGIDASGKICQDPKGGNLCTSARLPANCTEVR